MVQPVCMPTAPQRRVMGHCPLLIVPATLITRPALKYQLAQLLAQRLFADIENIILLLRLPVAEQLANIQTIMFLRHATGLKLVTPTWVTGRLPAVAARTDVIYAENLRRDTVSREAVLVLPVAEVPRGQ